MMFIYNSVYQKFLQNQQLSRYGDWRRQGTDDQSLFMSVLGTEKFLFISIQISYWVKQNVDKFPYLGIKWQHGEVIHIRLSSDQEENMWSLTSTPSRTWTQVYGVLCTEVTLLLLHFTSQMQHYGCVNGSSTCWCFG